MMALPADPAGTRLFRSSPCVGIPRWAASRSPFVQFARPRSAVAAPRPRRRPRRRDRAPGGRRKRAGDVPEEPRQSGTVDGDGRRQRAELIHPRPPSRGPPVPVSRVQPPFDVSQPLFDAFRPPCGRGAIPGNVLPSTGLTRIDLVGERLQPSTQRRLLSSRRVPGIASSMRSAARSKSSPAIA